MGYSLYRGIKPGETDPDDVEFLGDRYATNIAGWRWLRVEGFRHGWNPAGTGPPEWPGQSPERPWGGGYGSNNFQRVADADALAWAEALERGWPYQDEEGEAWTDRVLEFIAYCRRGGFIIG